MYSCTYEKNWAKTIKAISVTFVMDGLWFDQGSTRIQALYIRKKNFERRYSHLKVRQADIGQNQLRGANCPHTHLSPNTRHESIQLIISHRMSGMLMYCGLIVQSSQPKMGQNLENFLHKCFWYQKKQNFVLYNISKIRKNPLWGKNVVS